MAEQTWGQFNSGIDGQLQIPPKLEPQVNLPFNFAIHKYFFHDNPTWKINYSE